MARQDDVVYTLHYFPFSLYSLMARFGFVLGQKLNPQTAPRLQIKLVNLHREENFSEEYLTLINKKGQVPSLTSASSPSLDDSHDIARWLCQRQPELLPEEYKDIILRLMEKLYSFHAMALSIGPETRKHGIGIPNQAAALLENPDLSENHRRALEIKSVFHDTTHSRTLEPDNIELVEEQARDLMQDLEDILIEYNDDGKTWIFGDYPTILDAHATALAARLMDMERDDIVTVPVWEYAKGVMATEEWNKVTYGRRTVWDISVGHVAKLNPL
ncbi:hypothetical protein PT974_01154 [Cladobotryum mycophilum]|uniref:GST N-terminal domain-containing protein n=1 Tax=Cladobotryum mycophilum TaxID=491253 RepID=A0ABR0T2Y3_9HYPO